MTKADTSKINRLIRDGFFVSVHNPAGKTFTERYRIYQLVGVSDLKTVIINDDGKVIGLQG